MKLNTIPHCLLGNGWLPTTLCLLVAVVFDSYTVQAAVTEAWVQRYNGPSNDRDFPTALAVDGSGNVVVTGSSNGTNSTPDYYTAKYAAANGALLWEKRYEGPAYDESYAPRSSLALDANGNVVVAGDRSDFERCYQNDYYTAKFAAADGALLWERRYDSGGCGHDAANAVAVDSGGNVVVTGYAGGDFGPANCYTAKYAAADGALLWEKFSEGNRRAVTVDPSDNVVVTGFSDNGTNYDYYTAKYAAAEGTLLWEQHYNGPADSGDFAEAVAVDGTGNVIVTGMSLGSGDWDYHTAKYAAVDGALLWEQRYNGPANKADIVTAVAVDSSGNVVVTGYSFNGSDFYSSDYYTAKYAAADGALLWEQLYHATNSYPVPNAVAVDGSGNVVMTGTSEGGYYTAKYAAADGAFLWEKRYHGGASTSLAIGPNGIVAITGFSSISTNGYISGDYATVVYRENLPPLSIALVPTGIHLCFTGISGRSYTIDRAPAVTGPWTTINTQTAPASGLIDYIDTTPPAGSAFYRAVQP